MIKKGYYLLIGVGLFALAQMGQKFGCSSSPEKKATAKNIIPKAVMTSTDLTDSDLPTELADKVTKITSSVPIPPISSDVAKANIVSNTTASVPQGSGNFVDNLLSGLVNKYIPNNPNLTPTQNLGAVNNSFSAAVIPFNQFLEQINSKLPYQLDKDIIWQRADLTTPQQVTFSYNMPRALQQQLPANFHQMLEPTFQNWACSIAPQMMQYGFDVTILVYDKENKLSDRFFISRDSCAPLKNGNN